MKKIATLIAAGAIAASAAAPVVAQEVKTNDPFVTTQSETGLGLSVIGTIAVTTVIIAIVIGLTDSSSSSTTTN